MAFSLVKKYTLRFWELSTHYTKRIPHKKIIAFFLALFALFYWSVLRGLPNPALLKNYKVIPVSSEILDRNGKLLFKIYHDQNRTPITLSSLPPYIKNATIAIEDKDFYRHQGVSLIGGMIRAIKDMILKKRLQGGSTITQQLVKSALLTPERTIQRKVKEIILALWTEKIFTKDQILEMYLNQVPYGGSSYGIEQAAKTYFNKSAQHLTLPEASFLAGLPQAPTLYSPYVNPDRGEARKWEVLRAMCNEGYLLSYSTDFADKKKCKDAELKQILGSRMDIEVVPLAIPIKAPHFVFYVKSLLEEKYGTEMVEEGGLKVYTTLDSDIQRGAEQIVREEIEKLKKLDVSNGAALVTRPPTGEILAMVGSKDYFATPGGAFNVTVAKRQPGSAIKPLNYAVGIERKLVTPSTVFLDVPICFRGASSTKSYCPHNYDGQFHGLVQLRFALGNSYNIPAVKMLALNGVSDFVSSSSAFLINTFSQPERYGLSLTLGGAEVKMIELASAFSAFANQGIPKELVSILKIEDKRGKLLYTFDDPNIVKDVKKPLSYPDYLKLTGKQAVSIETAFLISHILLANNARSAAFGSGGFWRSPRHAGAGKTGTTNDKRDNWTIGYTPNFLTAVWVGNNDNSPMHPFLASGVTGAAPIWNGIMKEVLKDQPDLWPKQPSGIVGKQVCTVSGVLSTKNPDGSETCPSRYEYFIKGTEPKTEENLKRVIPVSRDTGFMTRADDPAAEMKEKLVIQDEFSTYCLDCNHEGEGYTTVKL